MSDPITEQIHAMGKQARAAAYQLAALSSDQKNTILSAMAQGLRDHETEILAENQKDLNAGQEKGLTTAMIDRLKLDPQWRREALIALAREAVTSERASPNGMRSSNPPCAACARLC